MKKVRLVKVVSRVRTHVNANGVDLISSALVCGGDSGAGPVDSTNGEVESTEHAEHGRSKSVTAT